MEFSKELRHQLGLTRSQMAELVGCTLGQFAMAETGQRKMPLHAREALYKIEKVVQDIPLKGAQPVIIKVGKTAALAEKTSKLLQRQLKSRQKLVEKLLQTLEKIHLKLLLTEQFAKEPFLKDDDIATLRMKIIQRTASVQLDTLMANLLQQELAISAIQAQLDRLKSL